MPRAEPNYRLPGKVEAYLATLNRVYGEAGEKLLQDIIVNGLVSIHEGWEYDNWNGGTYGHAVTLTVREDIFLEAMDNRSDLESRIATDLNKLDNSHNEHVSQVFIEMNVAEHDRWREESGVFRPPMAPPSVPADALHRIWGPHHVRVFLSHKATVKVDASKLKQAFARCGIAAFVAHEDIEPTLEWQKEIERALFSMDALVALLTHDFHDSKWTDQEVGVAIGRGVPLIPVRLGWDPYGLMGKSQGLSGHSLNDTQELAVDLFRLLFKRLADKSRLFQCAITAYANSHSWDDSAWKIEQLLSVFEHPTTDQVERVVASFQANSENKNSLRGKDLLLPLLKRWTGSEWCIGDKGLALMSMENGFGDAKIPF